MMLWRTRSVTHKHKWVLLAKTYQGSTNVIPIGDMTGSASFLETYLRAKLEETRSSTSYLFQCEGCSELRTEVLEGKEVPLDPAEKDAAQNAQANPNQGSEATR